MRIFLILLMTFLLNNCHNPQDLKNTLPVSQIDACISLSLSQKDDAYVMKYYGVNRDKNGEMFYKFKVSDYFNLIKQNNVCESSKKAIIEKIGVTTEIKSTSGPKGETVVIFNFKVDTYSSSYDSKLLYRSYEFEIRSEPYNWKSQKTIKKIFDKTFSKGMKKIEALIVSDLEQL